MKNTRKFVNSIAEIKGWALQPNQDFLDTIVAGLKKTMKSYGYFLCPCREGWGDRSKDLDIICPCEYSEADIDEYGHCYCGLFLSKETTSFKKEIGAIPDRRPDELYPD